LLRRVKVVRRGFIAASSSACRHLLPRAGEGIRIDAAVGSRDVSNSGLLIARTTRTVVEIVEEYALVDITDLAFEGADVCKSSGDARRATFIVNQPSIVVPVIDGWAAKPERMGA
jgi:hypothetical protein